MPSFGDPDDGDEYPEDFRGRDGNSSTPEPNLSDVEVGRFMRTIFASGGSPAENLKIAKGKNAISKQAPSPAPQIVWVVEYREPDGSSTVCHVASSEELAVDWCMDQVDNGGFSKEPLWWFAVDSEEVDNKSILSTNGINNLFFVTMFGEVTDVQPPHDPEE